MLVSYGARLTESEDLPLPECSSTAVTMRPCDAIATDSRPAPAYRSSTRSASPMRSTTASARTAGALRCACQKSLDLTLNSSSVSRHRDALDDRRAVSRVGPRDVGPAVGAHRDLDAGAWRRARLEEGLLGGGNGERHRGQMRLRSDVPNTVIAARPSESATAETRVR